MGGLWQISVLLERFLAHVKNCRRGFPILQTLQNKPNTIADFWARLVAKSAIPDRKLFRGGLGKSL